jgi:hypothetical protein
MCEQCSSCKMRQIFTSKSSSSSTAAAAALIVTHLILSHHWATTTAFSALTAILHASSHLISHRTVSDRWTTVATLHRSLRLSILHSSSLDHNVDAIKERVVESLDGCICLVLRLHVDKSASIHNIALCYNTILFK